MRDQSGKVRVIEGKSKFISEIWGTWIHDKLNEIGVVVMQVGPDDGGLKLIKKFFHLRKDLLPCWESCFAFTNNVPDIFPDPGADPAVTRDRSARGSGGALCIVILIMDSSLTFLGFEI